jgi:hypothetical protein
MVPSTAEHERGPKAGVGQIAFRLQTRDPKSDQLKAQPHHIDPRKVAVIIVDPWNYHWCMTWSEQAGGTVPRLNQA